MNAGIKSSELKTYMRIEILKALNIWLFFVTLYTAILPCKAIAQSNLSVYGGLDFGLSGSSAKGTQAGKVLKGNSMVFSDSAVRPSNLGFRGTEAWGDTSAFFNIEYGLKPNSAFIISDFENSLHMAFIGLRKNSVGEFAIGTQNTIIHTAASSTDPGQLNSLPGNVIFPVVAKISTLGDAKTTLIDYSGSSSNSSWVVRQNNMINVSTARYEGIIGHAMYGISSASQNSQHANNLTMQGSQNSTNSWGLGIDYAFNRFVATIVHQSFKNVSPYIESNTLNKTSVIGEPSLFGLGGSPTAGVNISDSQTYFAATYQFPIMTGYLQWTQRKASSMIDASYLVKRSAQQIGVRASLTPNIEAWASIGNGSFYIYGVNSPKTILSGWQVGSYYWLSKCVNFYMIYGAQTTGTYTLPMGSTYNFQANAYALGLRYAF